jgi:ATP-dependent helicase/DNAse subunit B
LNELAACGYKFFARRVLLLREGDVADHEQSALETGSLVHEVLRAIFVRADSSDPARLQKAKGEVLEEFHRRGRLAARDPAFFELDWTSIAAMVDESVDYELARRARGEEPTETDHELPFNFVLAGDSDSSGADPFELALAGQIDRLEVYRERGRILRLKVLDYKTSRRLKAYADLLKPDRFACENLQMPLYALGAVDRFRAELSADAAVELSYIALKTRTKESDPQPIPLPLLAQQCEATGQKTIARRIFDLVNSAIAGRFDVDPLECSDYCPYRRICRYQKP